MFSVRDLSVSFGDSQILKSVSLGVQPGEIVGIIGPNGCGKTTLLNAISGFTPVAAGSLHFAARDVTRLPAYRRARLGLGRSFQSAGVFREMTVRENVMLALEYAQQLPWWWRFSRSRRQRIDAEIEEALRSIRLAHLADSLAGVLSGGQLRLLELLRLRLGGGQLLLIDEPTAGVSPVMRQELAQMIRALAAEPGRSVVIVEHDLKFLFDLVDRVVVLVEGEKYLEGTPAEVQKDQRLQEIYFGAA